MKGGNVLEDIEKYSPKSVAEALFDMQDASDKFFDDVESFITRFKIQRDINNWYSMADASQLTGDEFKRVSWNAIRAIVMEGK